MMLNSMQFSLCIRKRVHFFALKTERTKDSKTDRQTERKKEIQRKRKKQQHLSGAI